MFARHDPRFARHDSRETQIRYFNGAWYIVRRDLYPHTTYDTSAHGAVMVTRQGECAWVGARQGDTSDSGFTFRRWELPDRDLTA